MTLRDASPLGSSGTIDGAWRRLDPRMLLVHPVNELRKMLLPLAGAIIFGVSQGGPFVGLAFVGLPVAVGVARYLTTTYRIADGRIELQRGFLNRTRLSTPLDRVRTVDLTASVVHRLLGLTTVTIGTGSVDEDRLALDALTEDDGRALRSRLLADQVVATDAEEPAPAAEFETGWLRYAPFTSLGIVILGGLVGAVAQLMSDLEVEVDLRDTDLGVPVPAVVAGAIVALVLLVLALTLLGYLVTYWRFTLRRVADTWHLSRGLLTTRETSIDVERVAGVAVAEPPGLRLARGARLSAIVTGLDRSQRGSETLVPPAPAGVVRRAAATVLGTDTPLAADLVRHGPLAVRRRWVRALGPAALLAAVPVVAVVAGAAPWLLVPGVIVLAVAAALAADRVHSLGHALVDGHLVARSGSLLRDRKVLATGHVIGWTLRDTWFQRRAGLVTLAATTAGGGGAVLVLDVPSPTAVDLADAATPDLVAQFMR